MKALVFGLGLQGKAVVHDLEHSDAVSEIVAADLAAEEARAYVGRKSYRKVRVVQLNASDPTALEQPTKESATIALRTQQIIAHESGVVNVVDPLGGSYFVEALTDRMERDAMDYIERIDRMGGIVAAIEAGFPQKEIADAAYRYQRQIDDSEKVVVGVNRFAMQEAARPTTLKIDDA